MKKILILGVSGMLGSMLFQNLSSYDDLYVYGTCRNSKIKNFFKNELSDHLIFLDASSDSAIREVVDLCRPDVIINCIGLVKQLNLDSMLLEAINMNARLPHVLQKICDERQCRLIHFSTDCVFLGSKGMYNETSPIDAQDIYGITKFLGEVASARNALTLRTSIIGPELNVGHSLLSWFLRQDGAIQGYKRAVFSGLPTIEISNILKKFVLPNENLYGLYHLSGEPISKYELLNKVATVYGKRIAIEPDDHIAIDRSLDSKKFRSATGYEPKSWDILIKEMQQASIG